MKIAAFNTVVKKLGDWTDATDFDLRADGALAVLDLRSPRITGDITVRLDARRSVVRLLLPEGAVVDRWDLRFTGRGKVKDHEAPTGEGTRTVRLVGTVADGEVRVNRGGTAVLFSMFSRAWVDDVRRARREGTAVTVHDPAASI
ncbi:hypothetical protein Afil01_59380 [Actinorhabdospora filicis]|uniref:Uncharacterized protein n=1 Tax=Actinorhabdospora filicis TaxID=1785913 RepID=A0A9W6SUS4_9ACTN|nr:hypothetical protein [Actinorhabdospora filicis]GLZ81131.1 hypothetical protein Afil01_59380 [Actinorhabdospora filicis]